MLDEHFFSNPEYNEYLTAKYVAYKLYYDDENENPLFDDYNVSSTPTVLIAKNDGAEIDRIIGFDKPYEEFKDRLEKMISSKESLLNLLTAYEKEPNKYKNTLKLIRKYQDHGNYKQMAEVNKSLSGFEKKLKKMKVPYGKDDAEVSAYEYSRCIDLIEDYDKVIPFVEEFKDSKMLPSAFSIMGRHLYRAENTEEVFKVYEKLMQIYPEDYTLVYNYMRYSLRKETNYDNAIKASTNYYKVKSGDIDSRMINMYATLLLKNKYDGLAIRVFGDKYAQKLIEEEKADELNGYSWFWALEGKNLDSALKAAEAALIIKNDANIWDTLSMVQWKMGDHEKAIETERKALELSGGENKMFEERIKKITEEMNILVD